jgi:cell division septal protein FtsQ
MGRRRRPVPASRRTGRRRKTYHINGKRLALVLLSIVLAIEVVVAARTSPCFYIKETRVVGLKTLNEKDVRKRLRILPQTNIFSIKEKNVAEKLKGDPVILNARVHRKLPGTLILCITERSADFVLSTRGARMDVDSEGIPFRLSKDNNSLPALLCDLPRGVVLGAKLKDRSFTIAWQCLKIARAVGISKISEISVDQNDQLCLNVSDEFEIRLGRPEQLREKLDIAAKALLQVPELRSRKGYIDVTCVEAPALKLND